MTTARPTARSSNPLILVVVLFGMTVMTADIVPIELRLLPELGIHVPGILHYTPLIALFVSLVLWLLVRRRLSSNKSQIAAFLFCVLLFQATVYGVVWYKDSRVDSVPLMRQLTSDES